ncbi:Ig-like domain-containing protein [Permianibacter aggregans]|uniref:Uncharacterized protein n=1 Tax=Permianibacter aggregans TaxID=1510150 RepID=A0A4R6URH7_9GAMM|nr:Ig-like domain-containing protein [Permianibacter aggregans]QGX40823.1 DNRLRE domain-containing protein [Permianibacter aggregans]TDQ48359.1 hypothetical protein EV696_10795 [Permianibacter aggregans]
MRFSLLYGAMLSSLFWIACYSPRLEAAAPPLLNAQLTTLNNIEWKAVDGRREGRFKQVNAYRSLHGQSLQAEEESDAALSFTTMVSRTGYYRINAWWPVVEQAGQVTLLVKSGTQEFEQVFSQKGNGGQWQQLQLLSLQPGSVSILIKGTQQSFFLDALRLEYVGKERPPLRFTDQALATMDVQQPANAPLRVSDALGEVEYSLHKGRLPDGVQLDRKRGELRGRPFAPGRFDIVIRARDSQGGEAYQQYAIHVDESTPVVETPAVKASQWQGSSKPDASPYGADVSALLTIIAGLPEGAWYKANTNLFSDVWTPSELRPLDNFGNPTPAKIIGAWSSFDWDSKRADLIIYGGGHANYSGNDVYRWRASTQQWQRMSLPSEVTKDSANNYIAIDGAFNAPSSAHTYDNNIYLPVADRFLSFGGAAYNNGDMFFMVDNGVNRRTGPYLFDPEKANPMMVGGSTGSHVKRVQPFPEILGGQMWQNRDMWGALAGTPRLPRRHVEGCTAYAEELGKDVLYVGANHGTGTALNLYRYQINDINNPAADQWEIVGRWWNGAQAQTACAYDPESKLFVRLSGSSKPLAYWNLNTPGSSNDDVVVLPTDLDGAFTARYSTGELKPKNCGLDFDPVRKQFVMWCSGADVFLIQPPATPSPSGWTIRKGVLVASSTPSNIIGTGILGKWKYIPNLDVFIGLQDATAGNVWIYKPEGWQQPVGGDNLKPVVNLTAPSAGAEFVAGDVITLQAEASDLDGYVSRVDFYRGSTLIASDTSAPFAYDWLDAPVGNHDISALATDDLGAQAWSAPVAITVLPGQSGTVTLQEGQNGYIGTQDTYLSSYSPSGIAGSQSIMYDENNAYSPMLRFKIFASEGGIVPDDALIQNAQLHVYKATVYNATWGVHRLLRDWQETEANWLNFRSGQAWSGSGANGSNTDYVSAPDASVVSDWGTGWLMFDVTQSLQMMQNEQQNYGWRIIRSAGDRYNLKRFYTKDYTTDVTRRPKLVITYAAP